MKNSMRFAAAALALWLAEAVSASEPLALEDSLSTPVAQALLRNYTFREDAPTSEILRIDFKEIGRDYVVTSEGYMTTRVFLGLEVWWPELDAESIDRERIVDEAFMAAFPDYAVAVQRPEDREVEKDAYEAACRRAGPEACMWRTKSRSYRDAAREAKHDHLDDPIPELAAAQGIALQLLRLNDAVLRRIAAIYPDLPPPRGIYILHWEDTSF